MQNKKRLIILIAAAAAAVLLIISLIVLNVRVSSLSKSIEAQKALLIEESTGYRENDDYLGQLARMLAVDINQTRASLGLPVTDYPSRESEEPAAGGAESADTVFYDSITVLMQAETDNAISAAIGVFLKSNLMKTYLDEKKLTTAKVSDTETLIKYGDAMIVSVGAASEDEIQLIDFTGRTMDTRTASKEAVFFIERSLEKMEEAETQKSRMAAELKQLVNSKTILEICGDKIYIENESGTSFIFRSETNTDRIRVFIEGAEEPVFRLSGSTVEYKETSALAGDLAVMLSELDIRSEEEVLIDSSRQEIEKLLGNHEFKDYLESLDLSMSGIAREDNDYIYYDINHKDGGRLGSFSILKKLGDIYLVDADEVPVSSLKTISIKKDLDATSTGKMIIPENIPSINNLYSNEDSITFLLVGAHELNTDTMIIVHADKTTGKAYMIGIPRDLYWKGRKINSIYQYFGPEQFKKELSEITGLDISNYVSVDMYAFIDIINILGGIEVTLEEDLIDPTYRTRENGEWSTLNYPKGTYMLNGVEALRIARSRHGSNDFDRSQRQQLIIEAFLNRFRELNITDANKVYSLIQAMYEYVDTDFTLFDMMGIYNNYGSSELAGRHVLSFDNILDDKYSNTYLLEKEEADKVPRNRWGAWILLPKNNDWNIIKWYIRQIINGEI